MTQGKSFKAIAIEVFSIVFGVLLALGVSEWAQEREKKELAAAAVHNIIKELEANRNFLLEIHEVNVATIEKSLAALDEEEDEDSEVLKFIPGLQVRSTAWNAFLAIGASSQLDYELLLTLSEIYSVQTIYRDTGMLLVKSSMDIAALTTVNHTEIDNAHFLRQFQNYFQMILSMEETLLTTYGEVIDELNSNDAKWNSRSVGQ